MQQVQQPRASISVSQSMNISPVKKYEQSALNKINVMMAQQAIASMSTASMSSRASFSSQHGTPKSVRRYTTPYHSPVPYSPISPYRSPIPAIAVVPSASPIIQSHTSEHDNVVFCASIENEKKQEMMATIQEKKNGKK